MTHKCLTFLFLLATLNTFSQNINLDWAISTGGVWEDNAFEIAPGPDGTSYVVGAFRGTSDFDPSTSNAFLTTNGVFDLFVAKYDAAGNYMWAFNVGGLGYERAYSVDVDEDGSVYVTGIYDDSVDFDPGSGSAILYTNGYADLFIAKYDANGNYKWAFGIGGEYNENPKSIKCDGLGNIYLTGDFNSSLDFDPGSSTSILTNQGLTDVFLAKYDTAGNYQWAIGVGGIGYDYGESVIPDGNGNVYVAGRFTSTVDFDPSFGTANRTSAGNNDSFLAKYDDNGNYQWVVAFGSSNVDGAFSVGVDDAGDAYVTGWFVGSVDFDPSASTLILTSNGSTDMFLSKFSNSGSLEWAFNVGGLGNERGEHLSVDDGAVYLTGTYASSCDFDPSAATALLVNSTSGGAFVAKYNLDGEFLWVDKIDGEGGENTRSIATYGEGSFIVAGDFNSTVSVAASATLTSVSYYSDVILAKFSCSPEYGSKSLSICDSTFISGTWYYKDTLFNDTLSSLAENGCDSIINYDLSFHYTQHKYIELEGCDSINVSGNWYTASTQFTDQLGGQASNGCDSLVHYTLTVHKSVATQLDSTIMEGDSLEVAGNYYSVDSTYVIGLQTAAGCDSIVTLNLTVDTTVNSVSESQISNVKVYPNPSRGWVNIESGIVLTYIVLLDITGKVVAEYPPSQKSLNLYGLADGIYFLRLENPDQTTTIKLNKLSK